MYEMSRKGASWLSVPPWEGAARGPCHVDGTGLLHICSLTVQATWPAFLITSASDRWLLAVNTNTLHIWTALWAPEQQYHSCVSDVLEKQSVTAQ